MKIAVLEYLCGGGLVNTEGSAELLKPLYAEGLLMLSSVVSDLIHCGHEVSVVLDEYSFGEWSREIGSNSGYPQPSIHKVSDRGVVRDWFEATSDAERVLVIAPEIDSQLEWLTSQLRSKGRCVWCSSRSFLRVTSDKLALYRSLDSQVSQPVSWSVQEFLALTRHQQDSRVPIEGFVLKPRDGAGCSDLRWFRDLDSIQRVLRDMPADLANHFLVQPWLLGRACSLALIAGDGDLQFAGVCEQQIERGEHINYVGGHGPILLDQYDQLGRWCQEILSQLEGALGWIGVDFLWTSGSDVFESPILIEINPRLTTTYLVYRKLYGPALAEAVLGLRRVESLQKNRSHFAFTIPK